MVFLIMTKRDREFQILFNEARIAGLQAAAAEQVVPMIVAEHSNPLNDEGGCCGFAWVLLKVRRGREDGYDNTLTAQFGNWMKKNGHGKHSDYEHGVSMWIHEYGQSMQRKEAYAGAFAQVLRNAKIRAYSQSRMD
jgi:hypothetical protein